MHSWHQKAAGLVLAAIVLLAAPSSSLAGTGDPADVSPLSSFWSPAITRWEPVIVHYAELWHLDPNFVAAVVWKESHGQPWAVSSAGAVGLMGIMPFPWRPGTEELKNPWTNVHWGARALSQTIADGKGDLYYSLAAYNGSWRKVGQNNTRRYAASVLDLYARSVAAQNGLLPDGDWIALLSIEGIVGPGTITVFGPQRELTRYTDRPLEAGIPSVPEDVSPHATVIAFTNGRDQECRVHLWLVSADGTSLMEAERAERASSLAEGAVGPDEAMRGPVPRPR
jgi:hypothetical protein